LEDGHGLVPGVEDEGVVEEREGPAVEGEETRRGAVSLVCVLLHDVLDD
jgi:hypothetical protein